MEFEHECQKILVVTYKRIYLKNYKATISLVHVAVILFTDFPSSEFPTTHDHRAESFVHTWTENLLNNQMSKSQMQQVLFSDYTHSNELAKKS